jgi:hypothetical protein
MKTPFYGMQYSRSFVFANCFIFALWECKLLTSIQIRQSPVFTRFFVPLHTSDSNLKFFPKSVIINNLPSKFFLNISLFSEIFFSIFSPVLWNNSSNSSNRPDNNVNKVKPIEKIRSEFSDNSNSIFDTRYMGERYYRFFIGAFFLQLLLSSRFLLWFNNYARVS